MKINDVANLFEDLLKTANDADFPEFYEDSDYVKTDPTYRRTQEGEQLHPEMTEEIDQLVQDSLMLVMLLQRAFQDFRKDANEMGKQLVDNAMIELEDIEEALSNPNLLNFELIAEYGLLDVVDQNASMLQSVLKMLMEGGKLAPDFKGLDKRVFKWVNELIENNDKMHDLATSQSPLYEDIIADKPKRMVEQDERSPDEISDEDLHPDFKDRSFGLEDLEYSGEVDEPTDPITEKQFDEGEEDYRTTNEYMLMWPENFKGRTFHASKNRINLLKIAEKFAATSPPPLPDMGLDMLDPGYAGLMNGRKDAKNGQVKDVEDSFRVWLYNCEQKLIQAAQGKGFRSYQAGYEQALEETGNETDSMFEEVSDDEFEILDSVASPENEWSISKIADKFKGIVN